MAMDAYLQAKTEKLKARFMARCEELDVQKTDIEIDLAKLRVAASIRYTVEEVAAWLRQFCKGDPMDFDVRRRIIDTFINSVILYDEKKMFYYNIKDTKQVSNIEMIEAPSEIENLLPLPEGSAQQKTSARTRSSNAGKSGGA
jgi:site-specific DNA recombinase